MNIDILKIIGQRLSSNQLNAKNLPELTQQNFDHTFKASVIQLLNNQSSIIENKEGEKFLIKNAIGLKLAEEVEIFLSKKDNIGILISKTHKPQIINITEYNDRLKTTLNPQDIIKISTTKLHNMSLATGKISYLNPLFTNIIPISSELKFYISPDILLLPTHEAKNPQQFLKLIHTINTIISNDKSIDEQNEQSSLQWFNAKIITNDFENSLLKTDFGTILLPHKLSFPEGQNIKLLLVDILTHHYPTQPSLIEIFTRKLIQNFAPLKDLSSLILQNTQDIQKIYQIILPTYNHTKLSRLIHKTSLKSFKSNSFSEFIEHEIEEGVIESKNLQNLNYLTRNYMQLLTKNPDKDSAYKIHIPFYINNQQIQIPVSIEHQTNDHSRETYFLIEIKPAICDITLEGRINYNKMNQISKMELQIISTENIPENLQKAIYSAIQQFNIYSKIPTIINFMVY